MIRKATLGIMLILVLYGVLVSMSHIQPVEAEPRTWVVDDDGPADFSEIQEAISSPSVVDGDTILVYPGIYYEHVQVHKKLSLIGENMSTTIIDGGHIDHVVEILANNVNFTHFTVQNSGSLPEDSPPRSGIRICSNGNNISCNNIRKNQAGIFFDLSRNNILRENQMNDNLMPFGWNAGGPLSGEVYFLHDIDETNTVDGFPVYYWINRNGEQVPTNAGFIAMINSSNITVKDIARNKLLVLFLCTNSSIIENLETEFGAIGLLQCQDNKVSRNIIRNGTISLVYASNNEVIGNIILDSDRGMHLVGSCNNNAIFHNNFINNELNVHHNDLDFGSTNTWDDGYPSGGNYWSDYTGSDFYSGLHQNVTGSDGIGDEAYTLDIDNIDRYPLMGPFNTSVAGTWDGATYNVDIISNSTISDFTFSVDQKTISFNVTGLGDTVGFSRVTVPNALLGGPYIILVNDSPPITSNQVSNGTHTFLYFTYEHSTRQANIIGATVVSEFPSAIILPLFVLFTILAFVIADGRIPRRLKT